MVLFLLVVKAELEGVSEASLVRDANLCISIRNPLSDYEIREKVVLNPSEFVEQQENSKEPPCHFTIKWEGSKKRSTIQVLDDAAIKSALKKKNKKGKSNDESMPRSLTVSGEFVPILALECRGVEPYAFHCLGNEFAVISEGGAKFDEDVDLSDGDWGDYDAEHDASVSISEFEAKFISA
uniref:Uncharacterized protein n=1 Tax=Attheya septentrionalis TaxID=420275 RepID=A0A7S2USF6_9STRA|mmetsp:Transcript_7386/g.13285  ORF Transcript_7386/g.13285 Transcript_7386/m.13285 type:complete len:181 (+) Transcript_7386:196-738(+)|eukprot:CAMPEP_0198295912 /NCGR_PEP_ID=MMETSP1449-20131203/30190_1 /TAXON_ID=420275 /ORGANISM="Attheya septentrionalis, Strain CCMP2084" /LENGTH=180 /DNA_ID=CAMNT_0043996347 /DNA_START=191 /DNA_END=733 /DNA_ORIENTATION=+